MKKLFSIFGLSLLFMLGFQLDANACKAKIEGPSGRCAVDPGTPTTYTGTHNFSSSGCTYYEWTIEGGTVTAPDGTSVTNGTLCVTENIACFPDLALGCDVATIDQSVSSGNGADVTVSWLPGVDGKLKLKVKEKGTITLSDKTDLSVDLTLPNVTSLTASANSTTSTTFTANLDKALCPGMEVAWTLNGNFAGTGMSRTFSVGACQSGTVCAFTRQTVAGVTATTTPVCRNYTGSTLNIYVSGPTEGAPFSFADYILVSNQPLANVQWTSQPAGAVTFFGDGTGPGVIVNFNQEGIINICAEGTTQCGEIFQVCILVDVDKNNDGPKIEAPDSDKDEIAAAAYEAELALEMGENETTIPAQHALESTPEVSTEKRLIVQPTLAVSGQEIMVILPETEVKAQLLVTDIQGRQLKNKMITGGTTKISTNDLSAGIYILTARTKQWMESTRIMIR